MAALERGDERVLRRLRVQRGDRVDRDAAGQVAGRHAAHAVGDRDQPGTRVLGVLVAAADEPTVARSGGTQLQGHGTQPARSRARLSLGDHHHRTWRAESPGARAHARHRGGSIDRDGTRWKHRPDIGSAPSSRAPHHPPSTEGTSVTRSRRRLVALAATTTLALTGAHRRPGPGRGATGRPRATAKRRLQRRRLPLVLLQHRRVGGDRRPALHHRRRRHGEPLGRRHRPGRGATDPGRRIRTVLRRLRHPRRGPQGGAPARQRPLHHVRQRGRHRHRHRHARHHHLHRARRQRRRPTDLPDRRQRRGADVLPRQRVAARRRGGPAVRAGHRAPGPGQPGRLPARRAEARHRGHRRHRPAALAAHVGRRRRRRQRQDHPARRGRGLRRRTCRPSTSPRTASRAPATR